MWTTSIKDIIDEEGNVVRVYGIQCGAKVVDNITVDRDSISDFVELLNRCDASELHIMDLVEDFLAQ